METATDATGKPSPDATAGWDALAADGSVVHVRPVRPADEAALMALNKRVSDRSIYRRFFGTNRDWADQYSRHLSEAEPDDTHVALVAEMDGEVVAVGSFEQILTDEAEVAFLVDDTYHGRGIGTLLLEQLAGLARERGIRRLCGDTLTENVPMLEVFAHSGFDQLRTAADGVVELSLSTSYAPRGSDPIAEREEIAEQHSLAPLLSPHSVMVIGAGRKPGGIGHEVLVNLTDAGFTGELYAVNRNVEPGDRIAGVAAYRSIAETPGPVDLAILTVPAAEVLSVIDQCGAAGVRGMVILTSGFSDVGPGGRQDQRELVRHAREHGIRLVGPNCLGVANTAPDIRLDATFASIRPEPGSLALAAQSGAVGVAVLDYATRFGPGISQFVSLGDKADVSGNDLLLHWWHDSRTEVVGLYLESFGNPRKFGRLARLVGRTKPVLVVKGGRSGGGPRAGASHTAAAATPDTAVDALFAQSGVLRMDTVEDLLDTARVVSGLPLPRGRRVAIVGNAGGAGVLAADAAEAHGLQVPELSEPTRRALLDGTAAVAAGNPADLGAAATAQRLAAALRVLLVSGEADAVLVVYAATRAGNLDEVYSAVGRAAASASIPVLVNCLGAPQADPRLPLPDGRTLPVFAFPETAIRALSRAVQYAEWRERPQGVVPELDGVHHNRIRAIAADFLAHRSTGGWLDPGTAAELLAQAGITVLPVVAAASERQAVLAADRYGYPVALKTAAAGVVHKSDVGGVALGIESGEQLAAAYETMTNLIGDPYVIVQPMAPQGAELVVGLHRDDLFGPVLMAGAGGVLADLVADRCWRGLPLTDLDATEMLRSLRCAPLLAGYRGSPAADQNSVLDVLHRLARLAELIPEIAELDINPLVAAPGGAFAIDVRARLSPAPAQPDPYARRLR